MGKVPSKVKFDEDGFPIPQTMQTDTVQFDEDGLPIPVKKKAVGTDLSMVGGKAVPSGGQVGSSKAQSNGLVPTGVETEADIERQKKFAKMEGVEYDPNDPLKSYVRANENKIVQTRQKPVSESTSSKVDRLAKSIQNKELVKEKKQLDSFRFNNVEEAKEFAYKRLDKSKLVPKSTDVDLTKAEGIDNYTDESILNAAGDNITLNKAVSQYLRNRNVKENLQSSANFSEAAIKTALSKNDDRAAQINKLLSSGRDLPPTMKGDIVLEYLNDPDVVEEVGNNPELLSQYRKEIFDFPKINPETAIKIMAQMVSNKREQKGYNNGLLNAPSQSTTTELIDELVKEGQLPVQYKYLYERPGVAMAVNSSLKTPGFIEGTLKSANEAVGDIGNSLGALSDFAVYNIAGNIVEETGLRNLYITEEQQAKNDFYKSTESLYSGLDKDYSQIAFKPKNDLHNFTNIGGLVTGQVLPMIGGGMALKAAGLVLKAENANMIMAGLQSFGRNKERAAVELPNASAEKQLAYATINTGIEMALSNVFNDVEYAGKLMKGVAPEVRSIIGKFTNKEITESVAKQGINDIFLKAVEKAGQFGKGVAGVAEKEAREEAATEMLQIANNQVFGGDNIDSYEAAKQVFDVWRTTFLGTLPLGVGGGLIEVSNNPSVRKVVYEMATNPEKYAKIIQENAQIDEKYGADVDSKLSNLEYIARVKQDLDNNTDMNEVDKQKFLVKSLNQKILSEKANSITEPTLKKEPEKLVEQLEKEKQDIIANPTELTKEQLAVKEALDNGTLQGMNQMMAVEAIKDPEVAKSFVQMVAEQAGNEIATIEGAETQGKAVIDFGEGLVKLASELYPKEGAEQISQPIELDPTLPEGWSGFSKVEYDENGEPFVPENTEKPLVSKPVELSTEIPEGFQGQPKVEYDEKGNPYVPEIEQKKEDVNLLLDKGVHLIEAERTVKNKFINEYHQSLNTELNDLKESLGVKEGKLKEQKQPDVSSIDKEYEEKLQKIQEPPPTPPKEPTTEGKDSFEGSEEDKGILNRLYNAKNTPEASKEGFLAESLKYKTKSQTEADELAKSIIDEFGIDEAIKIATSMKFDGDVNSLIFAESLNRLSEQESKATTQEEKIEAAKRFAEVGIEYDKMARYGGRFNSAINYFYKKSPLGIAMMENAKRQDDFKNWSKSKEKSWKEGFDDLMKDPEFKKVFEEQVGEKVKEERKETRKAKREKVHKAIDETMAKWAKKFSANLPEGTKKAGASIDVFKAAATAMKKAYDAGEAIGKVIQDAIDYITKETGVTDWDKDGFAKEWAERLTEKGGKLITDEELKSKVLDRFRKKLNGLTDKQKEEVVRKSFKKLIDNGALEYDEFKKIIQDVVGRGELTSDEQAKLKELVGKTNAVEEAAKKYREERTEEAEKEFRKAEIEAGKATRELNEILWNRPDVIKRITSIMQLNTLGIPALINNPIYNIWNQATLRFPIGIVNDLIDRGISLAAKITGNTYERDYNVWETQKEFFKKLGFGSKESVQQLLTGLNRMDYIQKEVYGQQIRPGRAMRDLYAFATGKKNLTKAQIIDKALQATVGVPAEAVARMLNIGDKPQRFAAEGAQASTFAKNLGLKDMDYKLFIEFPREEAYRIYKEQGLSDAEAGKKADYIKDVILKEGQRSTFQQDNLLNSVINAAFGVLGGKDSGYAALAKTLTVSPFIKIPSNAFWSYYNLVNPEVAMLQSLVHVGRTIALDKKGDNSSKLAMREARYWLAHAIVGMAMRAVVIGMVQAGVFRPANDEDDTKKEREGEAYYEQQGSVNLAKLSAWLRGQDPTKVKGGVLVQNRWFGQWGTVGNSIAKKWQDATPEQREKQDEFWNIVLGGMEVDALKEMGNGVFANTSALLSAIDTNGSFGWSQYGLNTVGLFTNILHPATFAQISRAQLNEATTNRADTFLGQLKNAMLTRSSVLRKLTGQYPETKVGIWGDKIQKQGGVTERLFGITPSNKDAFARPIYDDAVRTNDIGFFPPAVQPKIGDTKLTQEQYNKFQEYVGKARRSYVAPFINDAADFEDEKEKNGVKKIIGFNVYYSQLKDGSKKYILSRMYELGYQEGLEKFYEQFRELKPKEEQVDYVEQIQREIFNELIKYQR